MRPVRRWSALAVLIICAPVVGCVSLDVDFGRVGLGGGSEGNSTSTRNGSASSAISYLTRDVRKEVLVLVEGSASGGVGSGDPPGGTILAPGGRTVNWSCHSRFGKLREMRIDDTAFPLEAGRVFHIDVRGERVLVRQLDLDPDELVRGEGSLRENLRAHAAKDPVVAGFCERTNPAP